MPLSLPVRLRNGQTVLVRTRLAFGLICLLLSMHAVLADEPAAAPPTVNLTSGCVERYDPAIDYFPEKATLVDAKGFTLQYFKHYKLLTVTAPWPEAKERFRYVLVQCGTPVPKNVGDAQVIEVPIRSVAVLSTTHLPHLELLGALDRLVAVSSFDNVYSPAVRQSIDAGKVAEIGRGPSVNLEAVLDLQPDLVTAVGRDQPQYNTHPLLQNAGIHVAIIAEYVEPTLLGRSEWLKFTAAFLNLDGLAQRRFAAMAARYASFAAMTRDLPAARKPTVFGGMMYRDVWYVPGGESYIAQWVADAGGVYLWADDRHRASLSLSFETVFERASSADFWFTNDLDGSTRVDILAANERYGAFKAFRDGRVYDSNARLNAHKANDYWESGVVEPDVVLADMIKILHRELLPDHLLKYYRRLP